MEKTNTATHTPAPWCVAPYDKWVRTEFQQPIAMVEEAYDTPSRANARLISAAPDLLGALTTLYEETADYIRINNLGDVHHNRSMQLAAQAIAKATGGVA